MAQSWAWCFTINNYTEEDVGRLCAMAQPYCVLFGKEEAPTTGTKHLQGLLWREDEHRFKMSTAENMLGGRAYLTACKDFEAAQGYCVKEGEVYSNCMDIVALRRIVAAAAALSKCNYWLGSALQHVDSPDDFLSDPKSLLHSHIHCAHCPKH